MTQSPDALLTVQQTAARLSVHSETIRRLMREGKLAGTKIGRVWRVSPEAVERLLLPTNGVHRPEPRATDEGHALNDILALGARLTANTAPLRDDAVRRSYGDDDAVQDEHAQDVRGAA